MESGTGDNLSEAWQAYRSLIEDFAGSEQQLLRSYELLLDAPEQPGEELVAGLAERSEILERDLLEEQERSGIEGEASERVEDFTLAVAALDMHLAADVLRLAISKGEWEELASRAGLDRAQLDLLLAQAQEQQGVEAATRLSELLDDADAMSQSVGPAIAGAQESPSPLAVQTDEAVNKLFAAARPPLLEFVGALPAAVPAAVVSEVFKGFPGDALGALVQLRDRLGLRARAAVRLIISALRKVCSALGLNSEKLVLSIGNLAGAELEERFTELRSDVSDRVIGKIVRLQMADERIRHVIERARPELRNDPPGELYASFTKLNTGFEQKQGRARKLGVGMKTIAPVLVVLHPPLGAAGLFTAVMFGSTYSLLGLADRLDTISFSLLNRNAGVPTLLESQVAGP